MSDSDEFEYDYDDQNSSDGGYEAMAEADESMTDARSKQAQREFKVIKQEEILQEQDKLISDVSTLLDVPHSCAGIMLRHFRWDSEKLNEKYWEDPTKVQVAAGVQHMGTLAEKIDPETSMSCDICYETFTARDCFGLGCNHRFCRGCWHPYLSLKIQSGADCIYTTCPMLKCNEVVNELVFREIIGEGEAKLYHHFLADSYVNINTQIKWCPAVKCGNAVKASGAVTMVKCTCGNGFCFRCDQEDHAPVNCEQLEKWLTKCSNDSETANWILSNTKKCPKCSTRIEKNQGCNHMNCRQCKNEFCWICMGNWADHGASTGGYYKCNRFGGADAEDAKAEDGKELSSAERAKRELDRYLHYYQRFHNHDQAGKFAVKAIVKSEQRMEELQEASGGQSWVDVEFLRHATECLVECRRVLKYTYVLGFYMASGKERDLFEFLQEDLEKHTELLTENTEKPIEEMNRPDIVNYTRVTTQFREKLLADCGSLTDTGEAAEGGVGGGGETKGK